MTTYSRRKSIGKKG